MRSQVEARRLVDKAEERLREAEPRAGDESKPGGEASRLAWEPVNLAPVLAGKRVTPIPSVLTRSDGAHLFYPGRTNGLFGETESAKTFVALFAAAQELRAGDHVVFVDYEDVVETAVERLLALGASADAILARFSYFDSPGTFDELAEGLFAQVCETRGVPTLVVLDGVTEAMAAQGLDPDRGVDVARFYGGTPRALSKTGAPVVLLDHVTKDRRSRGRWAIGSERKLSGLTGAAYAIEVLSPFGRERTGLAKLSLAKDRCGHLRRLQNAGGVIATFEMEGMSDGTVRAHLDAPRAEVGLDSSSQLTIVMERVSKTLESASAPLSTRLVRTQTSGNASNVDSALRLLVAEGFAVAESGPRGASLHRSVRPFRAGDERHEQ